MCILKFESFINEELKKSRLIYLSKIDLENICLKLNIPFEDTKYLSSGSWGDAYVVGDKVLKLTYDKKEAKSVYDVIKGIQNPGLVKYHDVVMYKLKDSYIYVILMDYVEPLENSLNKMSNDFISFVWNITDTIFYNWGKFKTKQDLIDIMSKKSDELDDDEFQVPETGYKRIVFNKIWKLYNNLKSIECVIDIHPRNLGINSDDDYVLFDFAELKHVHKFDQPRIIR